MDKNDRLVKILARAKTIVDDYVNNFYHSHLEDEAYNLACNILELNTIITKGRGLPAVWKV